MNSNETDSHAQDRIRDYLRELKSTFRYNYENDMENESERSGVRQNQKDIVCPLESSLDLFRNLDGKTIIIMLFLLLFIVYMCLNQKFKPHSSINLILATSDSIKFKI